ncbi:MAG: NAD(+)/NADH kinase [candidate division WOR-3 bacterium]|nr:NAD(+)/NADH kinase [candidate division WOR-3 bacterium]MDW7987105.1 NAD(+)/NADH kinase [candidate division WOR-3 bacterium]
MKVGLVVNYKKTNVQKILKELLSYFKTKKIVPLIEKEGAIKLGFNKYSATKLDLIKQSELILAIGGDGTLLRAAHIVKNHNIPLLGINLGSLGFLTLFSPNDALKAIESFINKECLIEKRMVLEVTLGQKKFYALNDCAINMGPSCRVIELVLLSNKSYICRLIGDGVVIATPTGSTAYSLSCGGPIIYPSLEVIVITPISPHILSGRPIVIPSTEHLVVKLVSHNEDAILTVDGQIRKKLSPESEVEIRKAQFNILLVTPSDKSYYDILRTKMKWAEREISSF